MKYLTHFTKFQKVFEATFDLGKKSTAYIPTDQSKSKLVKLNLGDIKTFSPTTQKPQVGEEVLLIRPTTFEIIEFPDTGDFLIWDTGNSRVKWAVAKVGSTSKTVVQSSRIGGSARGDYFRETAFLIILCQTVWEKKGKMIKGLDKSGRVLDIMYNGSPGGDEKLRWSNYLGVDKEKFEHFCENQVLYSAAVEQAKTLINWIGDGIENVSYFVKNRIDLVINKVANREIKRQIDFYSSSKSSELTPDVIKLYKIPEKTTIEKWNPSDIWICFRGHEDGLWDETYWNNFKSLQDINEHLKKSLVTMSGIIGVSLKQQTSDHKVFPVNLKPIGVKHSFVGLNYYLDDKTVSIWYRYSIFGKEGTGKIDLRTFDTKTNSSLGIEVKGSDRAEHVSGKAGAFIKEIVPQTVWDDICFIKKNNQQEIYGKFYPHLATIHPELLEVFEQDIQSTKTGITNSRMQAAIFMNYFLGLEGQIANKLITKIVRFAKSESEWSSVHLILK